MTSLNF